MTEYHPMPDGGIPFQAMHDRYGKAEFAICLKYSKKQARFTRVWVTPMSQGDPNATGYELKIDGEVHGWYVHQPAEESARVWFGGWCDEHSAHMMRLYVPLGTNRLVISPRGDTLDIEFRHVPTMPELDDRLMKISEKYQGTPPYVAPMMGLIPNAVIGKEAIEQAERVADAVQHSVKVGSPTIPKTYPVVLKQTSSWRVEWALMSDDLRIASGVEGTESDAMRAAHRALTEILAKSDQ